MNSDSTFLAFERDTAESTLPIAAELPDLLMEIDQQNHWFEKGEIDEQQLQFLVRIASRGLYELFHYCFAKRKLDRPAEMLMVMRRFVAVAWLIRPEMLKGKNGKVLTLEDLSALPFVKCSKCALSLKAQAFSKRWNFHARVQKRETTKTNYSIAAKRAWKLRKQKARKLDRENVRKAA